MRYEVATSRISHVSGLNENSRRGIARRTQRVKVGGGGEDDQVAQMPMPLLGLAAAIGCMTRFEAGECRIQLPARTHQLRVTQAGAFPGRGRSPGPRGRGGFHLGESGSQVMPGGLPRCDPGGVMYGGRAQGAAVPKG
jgi:hypothetical protein